MTEILLMWYRSMSYVWGWILVLLIPYYVYKFLIGDGIEKVVYYTRCKMGKPVWYQGYPQGVIDPGVQLCKHCHIRKGRHYAGQ